MSKLLLFVAAVVGGALMVRGVRASVRGRPDGFVWLGAGFGVLAISSAVALVME